MRVIVVGAGVAGLAAADAARCAGADVVVLEARDRIGGRTWTVPLGPGSIDLGAAWVHGPVSNPVAEALATAGISTRNDGNFGLGTAIWADGWVDAPEATTLTTAAHADFDPGEAVDALTNSDSFVDGIEWFLADRGLSGRGRDLARFVLLWVVGGCITAGPPDRISLRGSSVYEEGAGGNLIPEGGYRTLVERMAAGLDLRLDAPATRLEHGDGDVVVETVAGPIEGDRAVVTVPLGVLQSGALAFDPPLGDRYERALERLAMGTLEKVVFRFPERFWPQSVRWLTYVSEGHSFPQWGDLSRHTGAPTLVAFYNPACSPALAEMHPDERAGFALDALERMFGSLPDPEETLVTDWAGEQWSLGSYSYLPIGATAADMRQLAEPVSARLVLAGEATVPEAFGTVHAAFGSGLRGAAHVLGEPPAQLSLGAIPGAWLE